MFGVGVALTVPVSMASLNVMTMSAVVATSIVLSAGVVDTIHGLMPIVVNRQGLGAGPGMRSSPSRSLPVWITTVYCVFGASGAVGVSRSVVSLEDQENVTLMVGAMNHVTEVVFIGPLKTTSMTALSG